MLALALTTAAAVTVVLAVALAVGLRRRRGRRPGLSSVLDPMPAGVKHLATTVSDLSDLGLHLPAGRRVPLPRKPTLGSLLDLRQP